MNLIEQIRVNDVSIDGYQGTYYSESPEWVKVIIDSENKVLAGIKVDGTVEWSAGVPTPIREELLKKVDKEDGKSLIDSSVAESIFSIDNLEYLTVTTDSEDRILQGIKVDGTTYIGGDVTVNGNVSIPVAEIESAENPEYLQVTTDREDKIVMGIKKDGAVYIPILENDSIDQKIDDAIERIDVSINDVLSKVGPSVEYFSEIDDPEGRSEIKTDLQDKIITYRDEDGVLHEKVGIETNNATVNHLNLTESGMTEFQQALKDSGFDPQTPIDWSDKQYIHIPTKPTCAVINITGVDELPQYKGVNSHAWMEFWDKNGNYFKKRVILDAQGRSSLMQHKKNFSADFCEDEWEGDETTTIKIGDWVSQDSFHFKAYYTDMFKFANITGYRIWESFRKTMNITNDKPFKEFFIDDYSSTEGSIDNFTQNSKDEAKCVPDGFPVCVYLNGDFYGVFFWQLKKHRDNYLLDRNKTNNIHLDGEDYANFFNGIINWEKLEIRNPKPKKSKWTLYCMDGTKYDGDSPKELIDSSSENWDGSNISHIKSAEVKENIIALSHYMSDIAPYEVVSTSNGDITIGTFRGDYANDTNYTKGAWVKSANNYYMSLHSSNTGNPVSDTSNWVNISSNLETLRSEIEKRFGIRWLIDYVILVNLEHNSDIFLQNGQWITWGDIDNHMKWSICPYDHDYSFGVDSVSSYKFISPEYGAFGDKATTPIRYVYKYYIEDVRERWKSLRDAKIIDKDTIMSIVTDLVNSIGNDNYELEYEKWDESPCCRASGINAKWQLLEMSITYNDSASNWSSSTTYFNGSHVKHGHMWFKSQQGNNIGHEPNLEQDTEWWKNVSAKPGFYAAGSEIWDGYSNFFRFKALEDVTITEDESFDGRLIDHYVDAPFEKLYQYYPHECGVFDSLYRIYYWLQEQIEIIDNIFLYQ